jgi:beta-barrel assembly-enhancing protease
MNIKILSICNLSFCHKFNLVAVSVFLLLSTRLFAQQIDFFNYQPLRSQGQIPKEVLTASSVKYKSDLKKISEKDSRNERKAKQRFYLESNFVIDDLLRSGYVLFNDPLGVYVTAVAEKLLEGDEVSRKRLKFYVMRSSDVNAFATDQGAILVTTGLLSQIENEAQLAFILAHEIVHFQKKHTIDMFIEVDAIDRGVSKNYVLKKSTFDKDLIKNSYSRDLELEADKDGLARFVKTKYDILSVDGVFDVLAYGHLPFDDRKFAVSYFENAYLKFPTDYTKSEIRAIAAVDDDTDDSKSTHPNINKRRAAIAAALASVSPEGRSKFLLPESRFREMQQIARFEVPLLSLHQEQYYRGMYEAWLSLQAHPNNFYLQKTILKGIYTASKYRNNGQKYLAKVDSIEGELQGLVYFIEKLNNADLNVLAVAEAWRLHRMDVKDEEVAIMANDALKELFFYHFEDLSSFSKEKAAQAQPISETVVPEENAQTPDTKAGKGKMEKIREQKKAEKKTEKSSVLMSSALAPYIDGDDFQKAVQTAQEAAKKREQRRKHYDSDEGKRALRREQLVMKKKGRRLNIQKVVAVNPFYINLDARKKNAVQFEKSEASQRLFSDILKTNAQKAGLKLTVLDVEDVKPTDVEKFNDIALLNQWFSEQVNFENLSITPGFRQTEINAIAQKYDTKFFCWTGVLSMRGRKNPSVYLTALFGPTVWPFLAYYAIRREYDCLYYNLVYNIETGGFDSVKFEYFNTADSKSLLNLHTYDAFLQIKSK